MLNVEGASPAKSLRWSTSQGQGITRPARPGRGGVPFTRMDRLHPRVVSTVFDHTAILKLIEWRWNLKPLTARDASSDVGNLAFALDLAHPDATLPALPNPA